MMILALAAVLMAILPSNTVQMPKETICKAIKDQVKCTYPDSGMVITGNISAEGEWGMAPGEAFFPKGTVCKYGEHVVCTLPAKK